MLQYQQGSAKLAETQCGAGRGRPKAACKVAAAQHGLALLARLFRYGDINYHGGYVNIATGATSALRIDPQYWRRTRSFSMRS